eukprot:scaffold6469_cov112-Cylindrotheca_fusiformis.AAC.4
MFIGEPRLDKAHMDSVCETLRQKEEENLMMNNSSYIADGMIMNTMSSWFGNYNVQVAFHILQEEWNYNVQYYDGRQQDTESIQQHILHPATTTTTTTTSADDYDPSTTTTTTTTSNVAVSGLLVNVPIPSLLFGFSRRRHWIIYKKKEQQNKPSSAEADCWFKLDSKQKGPIQIHDMLQEIKDHLKQQNTILIIQQQILNAH